MVERDFVMCQFENVSISQFKMRKVLFFAILLSFFVEIILIVLVYLKVGDERLPQQLIRFAFEIILATIILRSKSSNIPLLIFSGFHIINALIFFLRFEIFTFEFYFGVYHVFIGLMIYFHDVIQSKLKI